MLEHGEKKLTSEEKLWCNAQGMINMAYKMEAHTWNWMFFEYMLCQPISREHCGTQRDEIYYSRHAKRLI